MPDPDWWDALWPDPGAVLDALGIGPGEGTIVDLCCGDGLFTVPLARRARQVVAIDLDPAMLAQAAARLAAAGVTSCTLVAGDAYALGALVPGPADCVFIANTFHGVPDKPRLAAAAAAVLTPGGRFVIVNWRPLPRETTTVLGQPRGPRTEMRIGPDEAAALAEPAGFTLVRSVDLPPYHYGAVFRKASA